VQNRVSVGYRVVWIRAELAVVADQRGTWLPFVDRTPALGPLVRLSTPSWTPRHPALTQRSSILSLPLSRATSTAETPSPLSPRAPQASPARVPASHHASERLQVRLKLLHLLHPLVGRDLSEVSWISQVVAVGFTAVAAPIPANLAAAPFLPPFFSPCCVKVCLGLGVGSCHAILASVPPSCGNTAAAPPRSPPTSTSHVSRLTGVIRVRRFYLESSALSHWCLSRSSPTLYRSEMAGVSLGSSAVPPWPMATPLRRCNPSVTYLHRCGITPGARWCPWIRRRSSPSTSIRRRGCPLFSGSLTRGTRCQWLNGPLLSFIQIQIFGILAKIISPVSEIEKLWDKFCDVSF